jgi:serine/threonine protein kinase
VKIDDLPQEIIEALSQLREHYEGFERNDRGANGYLMFARNIVSLMDVAIKFYYGEPGEDRHEEPRQLTAVVNPNVLQILDVRVISGEWGYFITPRCFEGDLDDLISTSPGTHRAIDVALGICSGCSAIHALQMLHRDLKPGNIVVSKGQPKIADFGSVRRLTDGADEVNASRHSILYRPPESFGSGRYSAKGDVYQIGLVTYQLLGGVLPYDGTEYFSPRQRVQYFAITDKVDQALFIDGVIRQKAEAGRLIDLDTLPGWVDVASRRAIKRITHPDPARRLATTADLAAELTAMRTRIPNWGWSHNVPSLTLPSGKIELRPTDNPEIYVAYKDSGNGFRKVSRIDPGSVSEIAPIVATKC